MTVMNPFGASLQRLDPLDPGFEEAAKRLLARELNTRRVVCVVGAGVSRAYSDTYPNWSGLALRAVNKVLESSDVPDDSLGREILGKFVQKMRSKRETPPKPKSEEAPTPESDETPKPASDELVLMLQICRNLLSDEKWATFIKTIFGESARDTNATFSSELDPLLLLMQKLEISRFVTTNYDAEVEEAFKRLHALERPTVGRNNRFDTDNPENDPEVISNSTPDAHRIVQFAAAAPGFERGVFHVHGTPGEPENLVITESDYQRLYLGGTRDTQQLLHSIRLVFTSSPILFVGTSMSDPDFLRPLREFVGERTTSDRERPVFALLSRGDEDTVREIRCFLYYRYGVKTIFYHEDASREDESRKAQSGKPNSEDQSRNDSQEKNRRQTRSLCKEIKELAKGRDEWWNSWREKPPLRESRFWSNDTDELMVHHEQLHPENYPFANSEAEFVKDKLSRIETGVVVICGAAGTGKGTMGLALAKKPPQCARPDVKKFSKRFFATTHFSTDFLSVIEAAANFFLGPSSALDHVHPVERLRQALKKDRYLFVIGGADRLLRNRHQMERKDRNQRSAEILAPPFNKPPCEPLTPGLRDFFECVQSGEHKSVVVLTTDRWPESFNRTKYINLEVVSEAERVDKTFYILKGHRRSEVVEGFRALLVEKWTTDQCSRVEELCGTLYDLVRGHAYGLMIAFRFLESRTQDKEPWDATKTRRWLEYTLAKLSTVQPGRRPEQLLHLVLDSRRNDGETRRLLELLSLVSTPTGPQELKVAGQLDLDPKERLEQLWRDGLVCRIRFRPIRRTDESSRVGPGKEGPKLEERYTAHTIVRSYVLHQLGSDPMTPGEAIRFVLPGFTGEGAEQHRISANVHRRAGASVDNLLDAVEGDQKGETDRRAFLRAAFGIVRGQWHAHGLTALGEPGGLAGKDNNHYDGYQRRLDRLANAIRSEAKRTWHSYFAERAAVESANGILYPDELAWLHNEMGLVAFTQGRLFDCLPLWEYGREINRAGERGTHGRRERQSLLNIAASLIERGHLGRATTLLEQVVVEAEADQDISRLGRALGFLGWVQHLRGAASEAANRYEEALENLARAGLLRGMSFFSRLWGDLDRYRGLQKDAAARLEQAAAYAEKGGHYDLLAFTHISQAQLSLALGQLGAGARIIATRDFARKMGLPKLDADVSKVQAEIALQGGDIVNAEEFGRRAMMLSVRHGMKLRQTAALVLLGRSAMTGGNLAAAKSYLTNALRMARSQDYFLQARIAQSSLSELSGPSL